MALINCSDCMKEMSDKAAACPQCGCPTGQTDVIIKGIDPFAQYHTNIQGKKKGKITALGYIGIFFVAPLACSGGFLMIRSAQVEQGFMAVILGTCMAIGCYLWARR